MNHEYIDRVFLEIQSYSMPIKFEVWSRAKAMFTLKTLHVRVFARLRARKTTVKVILAAHC